MLARVSNFANAVRCLGVMPFGMCLLLAVPPVEAQEQPPVVSPEAGDLLAPEAPSEAPATPPAAAEPAPPIAPAPPVPSASGATDVASGAAAGASSPASGAFPLEPTATPPVVASPSPGATEPMPALSAPFSEPDPFRSPPAVASGDGDSSGRDESHGLFGPLRLGPVVGVGLPSLLSFGGTLKLTRYLGAGINVGLIPTLRISYYGDAVLSYQEYDVYGRIYPFGGGFFLGAGIGYATARGTLSNQYDISSYAAQFPQLGLPNQIATRSEGSVRALVVTPQLGYFHTFGAGFSVGVDFGAQIPIAPSEVEFATTVSNTVPQRLVEQYVTPNDQKVRDTLETVGRTPLPTINLKIGWLL
jgi:hypothetical protein